MTVLSSDNPTPRRRGKAEFRNWKIPCKLGHGIEYQHINPRGDKVCHLCAKASNLRSRTKHRVAIREREWKAARERGAKQRDPSSPTCYHGHIWADNRVIISGTQRCRECDRIRSQKKMPSREKLSLVLEGLSHGLTLHQMTSSNSSNGVYRPHDGIKKIIGTTPLYNFFRAHPALGKKMKSASKKNALINLREAGMSARIIAAPALMRNNGQDAFQAVQRATADIWIDDRGDVQALMWIDIGNGKLKLPGCTSEKAREYLKIHRRRPNVFGSFSLDTPIGEEGGMTWLDTKTDEDRLWG